MVFNMGKKNECVDCKLQAIVGGEVIELEYVQFRKSSAEKIADIMKNGVKRDNQLLVIDSIVCKKSEFEKLENKRYKATFCTLADMGDNVVAAVEFILGNIDIAYSMNSVNHEGDDVVIGLANVTVYPNGRCSLRELEDEE